MNDHSDRPQEIHAAHAHLEGRVLGVEREISTMSETIIGVGEMVQKGFAESRQQMMDADKRHTDRLADSDKRHTARVAEVHARFDTFASQDAERGRWNPGLILAAITCSVLLGGIFVAFVTMTVAPMHQSIDRITGKMDEDDQREQSDAERMGRIGMNFTEVGTKFAAMERRLQLDEAWHKWWNATMPERFGSTMTRLDHLEASMEDTAAAKRIATLEAEIAYIKQTLQNRRPGAQE